MQTTAALFLPLLKLGCRDPEKLRWGDPPPAPAGRWLGFPD
jgi:hypothetical protein